MKGNVIMSKVLHSNPIQQVKFDKNFCFLATCSKDGVKILDPRNLEVKKHFKSDFPMKACAFTPNMFHKNEKLRKFHILMGGGIIARDAALVSQGGYEVHIMDLTYQEEIGKVEGHFGPINWIEYH